MASASRRYVEPFAGSAAFFFSLEPQESVLGDTNETLAQFYSALKADARAVYELSSTWSSNPETYYRLRTELQQEHDPIRGAAIFFYLNRNCFNGIYRTNARGEFNVPFGGVKAGALPSWEEVSRAVDLLRKASIMCGDFRHVLRQTVDKNDFVYLDPPYAVENRRVFVQYNSQTFGIHDLEELAECLHWIDALGAKFVLSYAVSKEALNIFRGWATRRVACQRNVSGFAAHRRKAMELMITNIAL